ncbi:unnamed protein product [Ceutorhynchus assimilis]|uniref:HTH psq-type domain-containing protein n=1 Tax=Ceutorhynchus assimilis TaxID=467358 RepID=A0A9N9M9J7_9CUCU|nr:unnamed protein product [Ceutorhynchus assimilis]
MPDGGPQVRFQGCTHRPEWLQITGADDSSLVWLNYGLNTREWITLHRESSGPGQTWTFAVDDGSLEELRSSPLTTLASARSQWSEDNLQRALSAIANGESKNAASKRFEISRRTLNRYLSKGTNKKQKLGRRTLLGLDEETELETRIERLADIGYPLTKRMLVAAGFISASRAQSMNPARAQKLNKFIVTDYFNKLKSVLLELDLMDKPGTWSCSSGTSDDDDMSLYSDTLSETFTSEEERDRENQKSENSKENKGKEAKLCLRRGNEAQQTLSITTQQRLKHLEKELTSNTEDEENPKEANDQERRPRSTTATKEATSATKSKASTATKQATSRQPNTRDITNQTTSQDTLT